MKRSLLIGGLLCFLCQVVCIGRTVYSINEMWRFSRIDNSQAHQKTFNDSDWDLVAIPHTWNNLDAVDETPGYYRGVGWYRRNLFIGPEAEGKTVFMEFEGANQVTELYVNEKFVGKHIGGYTQFNFDISSFITPGAFNLVAIKVDNAHHADIPPLSADFTFFGGIYRDVYLSMTDKIHFTKSDNASGGVYISTPAVSEKEASVEVKAKIDNATQENCKVKVEYTVYAPDGKVVFETSRSERLKAKSAHNLFTTGLKIKDPALWSVESPQMYKMQTRILSASDNRVLDEVITNFGLRWYSFDPDKGFHLNGKYVKLIGTNRHQCYKGLGYALRDEMHIRDILLLKEMGGNFLRVSHYPQDPLVMEMCDKLGILTSVEIPIVNAVTESEAFAENSLEMAKEMLKQNYNHPSLVIWAYMNEVMLRPPFKSDSVRHAVYCKEVNRQARMIEELFRKEDRERYTMIPFHGSVKSYQEAGLFDVPRIIGWNLYQGWYGGKFSGFDEFMNKFHRDYPNTPTIITEYGADVDPRLHSFAPERFDYTAEYGNLYHEHYLKFIQKADFIAGATIWNLNDFYSEDRGNAVPNVNNKGINSLEREPKNTYLLYKASLRKDPVLLIGDKHWKTRGGVADAQGKCVQPLKIYSNLSKIRVKVNGEFLTEVVPVDRVATVNIPFINGENFVEASAVDGDKTVTDAYRVVFTMIPLRLDSGDFTSLNVMLGSKRYFEDTAAGIIWIPEQEYESGKWGYIGGEAFTVTTRHGKLPASDLNILNTDQDPVFQTQREGIEAFKLDVPNGKYAVYLYWAELHPQVKKEALAYNLGNDALYQDHDERAFNVKINGVYQLKDFNISAQVSNQRAIIKKILIDVTGNTGLTIDFEAIKGKPILNAVRVVKCD